MSVGAPIYWGLPVHYVKGMGKKDTSMPIHQLVSKSQSVTKKDRTRWYEMIASWGFKPNDGNMRGFSLAIELFDIERKNK